MCGRLLFLRDLSAPTRPPFLELQEDPSFGIADDLTAYKTKAVRAWLAAQSEGTMHYLLTYSSSLNQVEFRLPASNATALRNIFTSTTELKKARNSSSVHCLGGWKPCRTSPGQPPASPSLSVADIPPPLCARAQRTTRSTHPRWHGTPPSASVRRAGSASE